MPQIDLSILNQRQTPAFYADTLANRPAAGFIGRIFVSTNTFELYRDNGTGWDLIGGPGAGTVTGSGAAGQVAFWNAASTITGSNDLFWDNVNGHLGVNTNVPGTALDVHHDQSTLAILNQTVATNDARIGFQNNGVGLWRIGNFYNAAANDFGIFDAVNSAARVTVKNTGQTFIGPQQTSSGKLVVVATARDNGIILIGTDAPGFRINDGTEQRQVGIAMSTGANDFIQGSVNRDFCIFNASKAAPSPMLFGIHDTVSNFVVEAARISPARNFLIGTTTDNGQKLQVNGSVLITGATTYNSSVTVSGSTTNAYIGSFSQTNTTAGVSFGFLVRGGTNSSDSAFRVQDAAANAQLFSIQGNGFTGIGTATPVRLLTVFGGANTSRIILQNTATGQAINNGLDITMDGTDAKFYNYQVGNVEFATSNNERARITAGGNFLIGTTTDAGQKLQVSGTAFTSSTLTSTGNASTTAAIICENSTGASGTAQYYQEFKAGGTTIARFFRGNSFVGAVGNGLNIDNFDGFQVRTNQLGGSGGTINLLGGNVLIGTNTNGGSKLRIVGLPTSAVGLSSGDVYSNAGILTIVP